MANRETYLLLKSWFFFAAAHVYLLLYLIYFQFFFIKNDYSFQINFGAGSSLGVALGILSQTNYQQAHVVVDLGMETKWNPETKCSIYDENIEQHKSNWNPDGILQDMFTSFTKETTEYLVLIFIVVV